MLWYEHAMPDGKKILLSAVQPTNQLHLGNYLGAIRNWVLLQSQYECIFFAVDLHSITTRQDPKTLKENTYRTIATYIAAGIDPDHSLLFAQSHVPEHAELAWVLTCFSGMGELSRMTQFKDKSAKQEQNIPTGLFVYPALMAADILLYRSNLVPVGEDQKQHLELTRDLAEKINRFFGEQYFVLPDVYNPPIGARIMSLQNPETKMSKSDVDPAASIFLNDSDDEIKKKFKRAVTDSLPHVQEKDLSPGVVNLLSIQAALLGKDFKEVHKTYVGRQYGYLKLETADVVIDKLRPLRTKTDSLLSDIPALDVIMRKGAEKARAKASKTLADVYKRLGFIPKS
jgi:tryptophanyl-tRNA synthetase